MLLVRRAVVALSLSLAIAVALGTVPAHAEKWTHKDARGDVVRTTLSDSSSTPQPAPEQSSVDITKVVAKHGRHTLTITVRTRTRMPRALMAFSTIRTPGKRFMLFSMRLPGMGNSTSLLNFSGGGDDPEVRCRGLKRSLDSSKTVMTVSVPRSCLGNPRWIRFSAHLSSFDAASADESSFEDDGLRTGLSVYGAEKMSPKIKRG